MNTQPTRDTNILQFSPEIDGYSSGDFFQTISGAPAISSDKLRLNSAIIQSVEVFRNGSVDFFLNVPAIPTAGNSRQIGLANRSAGSLSSENKIIFDITDDVISAQIFDKEGTQIGDSYIIAWDSGWTATEVKFTIRFTERNVFFLVDDIIVAKFEDVDDLANVPLNLYVANGNADNMDIGLINLY